eukprot:364507-Chlamydomonas_euryale.AAC.2
MAAPRGVGRAMVAREHRGESAPRRPRSWTARERRARHAVRVQEKAPGGDACGGAFLGGGGARTLVDTVPVTQCVCKKVSGLGFGAFGGGS